jgi:hypothetical protein
MIQLNLDVFANSTRPLSAVAVVNGVFSGTSNRYFGLLEKKF